MVGVVLVFSGLFVVSYASWRSYSSARAALLPLVRDGDPTRTRIEAAQPLRARSRVRFAARNALLAMLWLAIAMYGLYLATVGMAVAR